MRGASGILPCLEVRAEEIPEIVLLRIRHNNLCISGPDEIIECVSKANVLVVDQEKAGESKELRLTGPGPRNVCTVIGLKKYIA